MFIYFIVMEKEAKYISRSWKIILLVDQLALYRLKSVKYW